MWQSPWGEGSVKVLYPKLEKIIVPISKIIFVKNLLVVRSHGSHVYGKRWMDLDHGYGSWDMLIGVASRLHS